MRKPIKILLGLTLAILVTAVASLVPPKGVMADVTANFWLKKADGQLYTNAGNGAGNAVINVAGCNGCDGSGGGIGIGDPVNHSGKNLFLGTDGSNNLANFSLSLGPTLTGSGIVSPLDVAEIISGTPLSGGDTDSVVYDDASGNLQARGSLRFRESDSYLADFSDSESLFVVDPTNGVFSLGFPSGGNKTQLSIQDLIQKATISFGANAALSLDAANKTYQLGNSAGMRLIVDDMAKSFDLRSSAGLSMDFSQSIGVYQYGSLTGTGNAGQAILTDGTINSNGRYFQYQSLGKNFMKLDAGQKLYQIGDIGTENNGTMVSINDATASKSISLSADQILLRKTITPIGTTGSVTINKPSGTVNFALGSTTVTVTDSTVTTASNVLCTVQTADPVFFGVQCVPGSGTITMTANNAPTAAARVGFLVMN